MKSGVDKLYINKLKTFPDNLNNLQFKVNKTNVVELETGPVVFK